MTTTVRVRGIYATAISKILVDSGFRLVEASEKIKERLGVEPDTSPCDVTVKATENPDELLILGFPREAYSVYDTIVDKLKYVFTWKSPVELYAVYTGLVVGRHDDTCLIDIGDFKGILYPCREEVNSRILVGVKKPPLRPGEKLLLTRNFRVVGKYIALIHGEPKITFSEHIYDSSVKAKLSSIAVSRLMNTGLGIHFRSSSKFADIDSIDLEISKLLDEYRRILGEHEKTGKPGKLREGEFIAIVGVTSLAKDILDEYRRSIVFTIDKHHSLKSLNYSDFVDFTENVLSRMKQCDQGDIGIGIVDYVVKGLLEKSSVEFIHVKPTGEIIRLRPGHVVRAEPRGKVIRLIMKREITSHGIYDGLGVEKKPGDVDYVVIDTSEPVISHNYYRNSDWLGSYINVNTPPEIIPGLVKYHDLLVDVVIYPSSEVKIVDEDELLKFHEEGVIPRPLYEYAIEAVEKITKTPYNYVFNPKKPNL